MVLAKTELQSSFALLILQMHNALLPTENGLCPAQIHYCHSKGLILGLNVSSSKSCIELYFQEQESIT